MARVRAERLSLVSVTVKDLGLKKLQENMKSMANLGVSIGYVGPLGAADHGSGLNMATLAAFQEFGTDTIDARPFLRTFYTEYDSQIKKLWAVETGLIFEKGKDPLDAYREIAKGMARLALQRFDTASSWAKPDDPKTIKEKGGSKPLVDSGKLREYLGWAVTKAGKILEFGKAEG